MPVAGRSYDHEEMALVVESGLDLWLTAGRFAARFEKEFAEIMEVRHALLCNSGSSANLLAVSALTSPLLGDRRVQPGDEIITVAAGFPTTVNPILQNGLVPVLVDIELPTYSVQVELLEQALSPRTRGIILAHTLGNPFDLEAVNRFARDRKLWLIEDNCDAVGSRYAGRATGSFGDLGTVSFYPAHHLTMGEGGCVLTSRPMLKRIVESFRDWGRDCWCSPGDDNTCGKRFDWQLGSLPHGYDHKYTYSHVGYNLKLTEMQAAVGVAQLGKLESFHAARRRNFDALYSGLAPFEEFFVLPQATPQSEPSWFGFPLTVRPGAPFERKRLIAWLEERKIATRLLFAGNITRQPAYEGANLRVASSLATTDLVMESAFWLGVYPGVTDAITAYVVDSIREFLKAL